MQTVPMTTTVGTGATSITKQAPIVLHVRAEQVGPHASQARKAN